MTVAELIAKLQKFDQELTVAIHDEGPWELIDLDEENVMAVTYVPWSGELIAQRLAISRYTIEDPNR